MADMKRTSLFGIMQWLNNNKPAKAQATNPNPPEPRNPILTLPMESPTPYDCMTCQSMNLCLMLH